MAKDMKRQRWLSVTLKVLTKEHWNEKFTRKIVFLVYTIGVVFGIAIGYTFGVGLICGW